jgi:hypothetical protein
MKRCFKHFAGKILESVSLRTQQCEPIMQKVKNMAELSQQNKPQAFSPRRDEISLEKINTVHDRSRTKKGTPSLRRWLLMLGREE